MPARSLTIIVNKNTPFAVEVFSRIGTVTGLDTHEFTREAIREADVLVVRSETLVDRTLLDDTSVRFVGTVTIGTDHIDTEYLSARGIGFANAPGSNANAVAEYVAAALLTWSHRTGSLLTGKTLGVVGVGNVGQKVVRVAEALGMNVILNDPPLARATGDASYRPLGDLMSADFISLHVPLTREGPDPTYHLFEAARMAMMKRGAVLINTSRGGVVETDALKDALVSGHLSSAILDVWEGEPEIDTVLLDRIKLGTPHIAGYSLDGRINALRMVFDAVCEYFTIDARWQEPVMEVEQTARMITVPASLTTESNILHHIVRQCYDIELDDSQLRRVITLPAIERGKYFRSLRAGYRIRREFAFYEVEMPEGRETMQHVLRGLGFKNLTRMKE